MATIPNDDDRLLVRIGYTPVRFTNGGASANADLVQGFAKTLLAMVDSVVRDFDSWCARISASNVWCSNDIWWARNMRVGVVYW